MIHARVEAVKNLRSVMERSNFLTLWDKLQHIEYLDS